MISFLTKLKVKVLNDFYKTHKYHEITAYEPWKGYTKVCENEARLERTIRQREKEISDLQKSLSDLQIFLLQEREQSVRLLSENDKLRIRELEDRKTMQHLLNIAGPNVAECSYFHKGTD